MNDERARLLISEQNFAAAVIGGAVATILAAATYGIVVDLWPFYHGFAAAGIGVVIGLTMGFLGRGISMRFAVVAALYTIAGCLLGNLFRAIIHLVQVTNTSPMDVVRNYSLSALVERAESFVSLVHVVYWFIAVFAAVFLARRALSRSDRLAIGRYESRR